MSIGSWLRHGPLKKLFGSAGELHRLGELRFCVLDIDVTGVSIRHDSVTGIALLPLSAGTFRISDLRYFALARSAAASAGQDVDVALKGIVAGSPIVTYNTHFVRQMMLRACPAAGLPGPDGGWIDLGSAAGVVASGDSELTSMDYWLERMSSGGRRSHDAMYDVFTMAQMLQVLLSYCEAVGVETLESLIRLQSARAWLRRS